MHASVSRIYEEPGTFEKLPDARAETTRASYESRVIAMPATIRIRRKKRVHFLQPAGIYLIRRAAEI